MRQNRGACYNEIFIKDANTLFAKVTSIPINEYEATLPYYQIRDLKSGEKTADIQIFKRGITNKHKEYLPEVFLYSHDAMKPDGSRIAQAMGNVPQLNVIDTETGKVVAYRLSDEMSLSDLETAEELKPCFLRACADDKYIYAAFWGKEDWDIREVPCVNQLYVFDWDGRLISKITTKHCIGEIAVDHVNRILYTTSPMDEKLYYIKTEELVGAPSSGSASK